jgi:hypothetical protein
VGVGVPAFLQHGGIGGPIEEIRLTDKDVGEELAPGKKLEENFQPGRLGKKFVEVIFGIIQFADKALPIVEGHIGIRRAAGHVGGQHRKPGKSPSTPTLAGEGHDISSSTAWVPKTGTEQQGLGLYRRERFGEHQIGHIARR